MNLSPTRGDTTDSRQWEGVIRNTKPGTKLFPVRVVFTSGARPMYETIRAASRAEAKRFAINRYPNADPDRTHVIEGEQAIALGLK